MEYYCGHLDEALRFAHSVSPGDTGYDSMRSVSAIAHCMKGEFAEAIQSLLYEPGDTSKFYSPKELEAIKSFPAGAKLIELQDKKLASVFQPARLLLLAHVLLAQDDVENAVHALDYAEKLLGPMEAIQASYCQYRAWSLAAQGKASEAETYLDRVRAIVQQLPKRSMRWEAHSVAGRVYLYLGRLDKALVESMEAQRAVLHPSERHTTGLSDCTGPRGRRRPA